MKSSRGLLIASLLWMVFFGYLTPASAQRAYIDPVNGDNRNPGISPATAKKNADGTVAVNDEYFTQTMEAMQSETASFDKAPVGPVSGTAELTRIILGSETLTGWEAFSMTVWQAPLELDQSWTLEGVSIDDDWLEEGCRPDFLDHHQYYKESNNLFINAPEGNPVDTGKTVHVHLYDYWTYEESVLDVTGWTPSPPSVWQVEFPTEPIHVFVDDLLLDSDWWYGPLRCEQEPGQAGYLYLKDAQGNPDAEGKTVAAVFNSGGWAVASADFNGDGFDDVVHSNNGSQIYINYGAQEFSTPAGQILSSPEEGVSFGFNVASAGDVNHDGFDDLIVAMDWGAKTVYLYMGSAEGLNQTPDRILTPPTDVTAYGFGHGIAGNGDINADGYADVLIMGGDEEGSYLCVYLGSAGGIGDRPDAVISYPGNTYGGSVCIPGDMDRDGFDEVAVSLNEPPPTTHIAVMIYRGSRSGRLLSPSRLRIAIPETTSAVHGEVAAAGDVNADGFADLLIGNQWADGDLANQGKAYLLLGPVRRRLVKPDMTIDNPIPEFNTRFGSAVAGIGDINQDGYADIAVGCPYGANGAGYVAVYSGSTGAIANAPAFIISGMGGFGWSLSAVGHPEGLGQPFFAAGEESGASYLYALPGDTSLGTGW